MTINISPNFIWEGKHSEDPLNGKEVAIMFSKDKEALVLFGDTMRLKPQWCYHWRGFHVFRLNPRQAETARELGIAEGDWLGMIRNRRASDCGNKRRFATEADAARNADTLTSKSCATLRAYQCPHCDGWHLAKRTDDMDPDALHDARARKGRISR